MLYIIIAVAALLLDQFIKYYAAGHLALNTGSAALIPGVLNLANVRNEGAAFGILSNASWILLVVLAVFTAAVVFLLWKGIVHTGFGRCTLLLILAGALGNGLDRAIFGYVVDMFEFAFLPNLIFNLADCLITVGAILFCLHVILYKLRNRDDDYDDEDEDDEDEEDEEPAPRRRAAPPQPQPHRAPAQRPTVAAGATRPAAPAQRPTAQMAQRPTVARPAAPAARPAAPVARPAAPAARPAAPAARPAAPAARPAAPAARPAAPAARPAAPAARPAAPTAPTAKTAAPKSNDEFDLDSILNEFK